jgi:hypothetical protein
MKGKFQPKNPQKYLGNPTNIIYRSKWELDMMIYFDKNTEIVGWASEELIIPYRSPVDNRIHRYFPDFVIKNKQNQTIVVEVKPYQQTLQPVAPKKKTKAFINEAVTYAVNQAKWKAAEEYCKDRGYRFQILTEKEIYGK